MKLQSLRVRNFKAVVDSKTVKLGALRKLCKTPPKVWQT
jgi:hypothetical protein